MSLDSAPTTPLPSDAEIDRSMASMEADVAEMFGLGQPSEPGVQGGETQPAVSPAAAASPEPAGGGGDQAPSAPPAEPSPAAPAATPAAPEASGTPAPASPPAAQPVGAAPTATPTEPPKPDEQALKLQSLEATVEALQAELASARANPPAQPAPAGQPGGPETGAPAAEPPPAYRLSLPDPVYNAIFGEETTPEAQKAGIAHLMSSLASIVHHNVRLEMRASIGGLLEAARAQEQSAVRSTEVEQGREAYYTAFPTHKNELITPLIQAEARQMAAEFPNLKWGPDYINALGTRVNNRIAALTGAQPAPIVTPPAAPAAGLPTGPRTETPGTPVEGSDLIMDTFS